MKDLISFLCLTFFALCFPQSLSITKVVGYASESNMNLISSELQQKGFTLQKSTVDGYPMHSYKKSSGEVINITRNDELRMVIYKPSYEVYKVFKNKVLTKEFQYAYSYKNNDYYESNFMRIGYNDLNGIISFFKPLK